MPRFCSLIFALGVNPRNWPFQAKMPCVLSKQRSGTLDGFLYASKVVSWLNGMIWYIQALPSFDNSFSVSNNSASSWMIRLIVFIAFMGVYIAFAVPTHANYLQLFIITCVWLKRALINQPLNIYLALSDLTLARKYYRQVCKCAKLPCKYENKNRHLLLRHCNYLHYICLCR